MSGQWPKDSKVKEGSSMVNKPRDPLMDYNPSTGHEASTRATLRDTKERENLERASAPGSEVQWDEVQCIQKAKARGDLTFTLVGQDLTSPEVICFWILMNIQSCPAPKLKEALDKAIRMRDIPAEKRKVAD